MSFKKYLTKLDNEKWSKEKRKQKRKDRGLRKGDGQLPVAESFGPTFSGIQSMQSFRHENEEGTNNREMRRPADQMGDVEPRDNDQLDFDNSADEFSDKEPHNDDLGQDDQSGEEDQGVTRTVKGAHLVYKKQDDEGQFEELWIFPISKGVNTELSIRKNILAGTDIPDGRTESEDGNQKYELWTAGNAQLMRITGLPQ